MRKSNKKGFTVVELVIVIAVIAILAGVLIPTFASLIHKANTSADIQACRQMNTYLAVNEVTADKTIFEVFDTLARGGMTGENYHPLVSDTYYFWDANLNRIMYVDKDYKVIYPEEYKGMTQDNIGATAHTWLSLSLDIPTSKPNGYVHEGTTITATATTAEEYAYVVEEYNKAASGTVLNLTVNNELDMKGSSTIFKEVKGNVTISGTGTIKNITSNKFIEKSTNNLSGIEAKYAGGGVIGKISSGTVTFENVTFENINVRVIDGGQVGIVVGSVNGSGAKVVFNNVTVKNSTVIGHRGVGSLVGQLQSGTCDIAGDVTLDNVKVLTVGGRSGLLVGLRPSEATFQIKRSAKIDIKNGTKMGIYENEASQQKIVSKSDLVKHTDNNYYASFDTNHSATVTEYGGDYYSTIIQSDTLVYSVKTFNDDGTVQYSLYGYDENALILRNENNAEKHHVFNNGFGAYHSVAELKSNPKFVYD